MSLLTCRRLDHQYRGGYGCSDGMCGAEDCTRCHPACDDGPDEDAIREAREDDERDGYDPMEGWTREEDE